MPDQRIFTRFATAKFEQEGEKKIAVSHHQKCSFVEIIFSLAKTNTKKINELQSSEKVSIIFN